MAGMAPTPIPTHRVLPTLLAVALLVSGCKQDQPGAPLRATTPPAGGGTPTASSTPSGGTTATASLAVTSTAFSDDAFLPAIHSYGGGNQSPPLSWSGAPAGTLSFAVVMDDPDADSFLHWCLHDIPAGTTALATGANPPGSKHVASDFEADSRAGANGYDGPSPPTGTHSYVIAVYALDKAAITPQRQNGRMNRAVFEAQFGASIRARGQIRCRFAAVPANG